MAEFKDVAVRPATIFPSPMIIPPLIFLWLLIRKVLTTRRKNASVLNGATTPENVQPIAR